MQCMNNFNLKKRYLLHLIILFCLVFLDAPQRSILCSLFFLTDINNVSNHAVSMFKQSAADDILFFIAHHAKTITFLCKAIRNLSKQQNGRGTGCWMYLH